MRQSFAMGCCILSYMFFLKEKRLYSIVALAIGVSVHVSALIALLFLVVLKIPLNKKNFIIWLLIGGFIAITTSQIVVGLFNSFFVFMGRNEYEDVINTGGWLRELFFVATIIFCRFLPSNPGKFIEENNMSIKALLLSAILLPIFNYNPALSRIYMYFSIFEIILIPNLLSNTRNMKIVAEVGYISTFAFFMYKIASSPDRLLIPYTFFWE